MESCGGPWKLERICEIDLAGGEPAACVGGDGNRGTGAERGKERLEGMGKGRDGVE